MDITVVARDAGMVIERDYWNIWWRCERCGRKGKKIDHPEYNGPSPRLIDDLQKKANAHLQNCRYRRPGEYKGSAFRRPSASSKLPCPVYLIRRREGVPPGWAGAAWLMQARNEGQPLVIVATHLNAKNNDAIKGLVDSGVPYSIPNNFPPRGWQGGPVLAPWPGKKVLGKIEGNSREITSLCVVEWIPGEFDSWAVAQNATELTPSLEG